MPWRSAVLAAGDDAASLGAAAALRPSSWRAGAGRKLGRGAGAAGRGVAAQGEAGGSVVPQHFLAPRRRGQGEIVQAAGCLAAGRAWCAGGGLPDLLAAVAGEAGERVGGGELLHLLLAGEAGAQGEVLGWGEGALGGASVRCAGRPGAQAADEAQAEAHRRLHVPPVAGRLPPAPEGLRLALAQLQRAVVAAVISRRWAAPRCGAGARPAPAGWVCRSRAVVS